MTQPNHFFFGPCCLVNGLVSIPQSHHQDASGLSLFILVLGVVGSFRVLLCTACLSIVIPPNMPHAILLLLLFFLITNVLCVTT